MAYTESNIQLNFPDNNHFRFQDLRTYQKLSGFTFKEMDACWLDTASKTFYLIELKDFSEARLLEELEQNKQIYDLLKKSIDSLVMLLSVFLKTEMGIEMSNEISFNIPLDSKLVFISILHIEETQKDYLNFIRDKYKNKFMAYAKLFDLKHTIMSREKAVEKFDWVNLP